MKKLTPTQFLMYATALTVGAAMVLPSIPWLRPVGILLLCVAGAVVRGEEYTRRQIGTLLAGMVLLMVAVVVGALRPEGIPDPYRPRTWYAVAVLTTWAVALIVEYGRWRRITRHESPSA